MLRTLVFSAVLLSASTAMAGGGLPPQQQVMRQDKKMDPQVQAAIVLGALGVLAAAVGAYANRGKKD